MREIVLQHLEASGPGDTCAGMDPVLNSTQFDIQRSRSRRMR